MSLGLYNKIIFITILFLQGFVMMWKKQADILTVSDQIVDKVTGKTFIWTFFNFHEKDRAKTNYFDRSTFDHDKRRTIFIYIFIIFHYEYCFVTTYSKHIHLPLSQHSLVQVRNIRQKYKSSISSRKKNELKSLYLRHKNISILYTGITECVCVLSLLDAQEEAILVGL